jgi:hypothetical protein
MATKPSRTFTPNHEAVTIYNKLYALYHRLHDSFGLPSHSDTLGDVMKQLLEIRDSVRKA